jgi:hypothetical protein
MEGGDIMTTESDKRWTADIELLYGHLEMEAKLILDGCDEDNPHEMFSGKLYLIAMDTIKAELARAEAVEKAAEGLRDTLETSVLIDLSMATDRTCDQSAWLDNGIRNLKQALKAYEAAKKGGTK